MSAKDSPVFIPTVKRWMRKCEERHSDACVPRPVSMRPPRELPSWVIDLQLSCIVPGCSVDRYFALSYTWPQDENASNAKHPALLLDEKRISDFQTPGFLTSNEALEGLPDVIKFAMRFTLRMGERCLWIDRLCIVQNDQSTQDEVMRMDKIYSGAYLTIIAAAPENMFSQYLDNDWPHIEYASQDCKMDDDSLFSLFEQEASSAYTKVQDSKWASRGWTYQEEILCCRAVLLIQDSFFWNCHVSFWQGRPCPWEEIVLARTIRRQINDQRWPNYSFYVELVSSFNSRQFSYPQDAHASFIGILNAIAPAFAGGFVFGLPRLFFDHTLLWQPFDKARRRFDRPKHKETESLVTSSLPSWAWCGWQCFVDPWSLLSGLEYIHDAGTYSWQDDLQPRSWRTFSIVNWRFAYSTIDSQKDKQNHPDEDMCEALDHAWRTGDFTDWQCFTSSDDLVYYAHKSEEYLRFKYPLPLAQGVPGMSSIKAPPYISCSTTTATLFPAATFRGVRGRTLEASYKISTLRHRIFTEGPGDENHCSVLVLQQSDGTFAGLMRLMDDTCILPGTSLELCAISAGTASAKGMTESFEWKVFKERHVKYREDLLKVVYYPEHKSRYAHIALNCDIAMAFNNKHTTTGAAWENGVQAGKRKRKCDCVNRWACATSEAGVGEEESFKLWRSTCSPLSRLEAYRDRRIGASTSPKSDVCEFYNVLWVEYRDGVAYRRACGWVPRHVWEANAQGPVRITLG